MNDYKAKIEAIVEAVQLSTSPHNVLTRKEAREGATASLLQLLDGVRAEERKEVAKLMKQGVENFPKLQELLAEARMQVWRDILGAGADNPQDLPDDFISVPAFWIKKQLAELKGEK